MSKRDLRYYKSLKYKVELHFDSEENCWFARLPELGDVLADGTTPEEALRKALRLKDQVLESDYKRGLPIGEPRPEVEYSGRFLLRIPKSLHQELAEEAEREETSINRLSIQILSAELQRRKLMRDVTDEVRTSIRNLIGEETRSYFAQQFEPVTNQPLAVLQVADISQAIDLGQGAIDVIRVGQWSANWPLQHGFHGLTYWRRGRPQGERLRDLIETSQSFDRPEQEPKKEAAA